MKKILKYAAGCFLAVPAALFVYWLVLVFPNMFFRLERVENLYIYHHSDEADKVRLVGERALLKIKKSSLYNPASEYRVFLTDSTAEYAFFTTVWRNSGGVFLIFARGNIFIRPSVIAEDRLIAPSGVLVAEDRPLNYFIAHETAHAMTFERIGFSKYLDLNQWVREGIADRIGRERFDYEQMLGNYRARLPMMDHRRSGLYLKFQLLVEYAIRHRNFDVESLLEKNPPEAEIEAGLGTSPE